jgi:hypothetical protein
VGYLPRQGEIATPLIKKELCSAGRRRKYMSDQTDGVKDISEVVTATDSPAVDYDKDFDSDIPEPQEVDQPSEAEDSQDDESEQHVDKKGANHRIRELNEKAKAEKARADSLAKQIDKLTASSQPQQSWEQLNQPLPTDESGQVDAATFERQILAKASALAELQAARVQHVNRVNAEANEVLKEYPVLDPGADNYDPELSEGITEAALAYVQANPTKSLKDYVNKLMKPYTRSVTKQVSGMAETITKQAAETALRPNSSPKGEKRLEEMSLEEMEARFGKVY